MTFEMLPQLVAELLEEQRRTRADISRLLEVIAATRPAAVDVPVAAPPPAPPPTVTVEPSTHQCADPLTAATMAMRELVDTRGVEVAGAVLMRWNCTKLANVPAEVLPELARAAREALSA